MTWTRIGMTMTCRHCGHDQGVHHAQPIGCGTAVRCSVEPYRRVQCPCPRFEYGEPLVMALPPLPPPKDPTPAPDAEPVMADAFREYLLRMLRR